MCNFLQAYIFLAHLIDVFIKFVTLDTFCIIFSNHIEDFIIKITCWFQIAFKQINTKMISIKSKTCYHWKVTKKEIHFNSGFSFGLTRLKLITVFGATQGRTRYKFYEVFTFEIYIINFNHKIILKKFFNLISDWQITFSLSDLKKRLFCVYK